MENQRTRTHTPPEGWEQSPLPTQASGSRWGGQQGVPPEMASPGGGWGEPTAPAPPTLCSPGHASPPALPAPQNAHKVASAGSGTHKHPGWCSRLGALGKGGKSRSQLPRSAQQPLPRSDTGHRAPRPSAAGTRSPAGKGRAEVASLGEASCHHSSVLVTKHRAPGLPGDSGGQSPASWHFRVEALQPAGLWASPGIQERRPEQEHIKCPPAW